MPSVQQSARARRGALLARALCAAAALLAGGCSGGGDGAAAAPPATAPERAPQSSDPRVVELRRAIEFGRLDLARTLFEQVGPLAGSEAPLLRARLELLGGDGLAALRAVEEARAAASGDDRVFAAAAEVYAHLGRLESAAEELRRGQAVAGRTAELERAAGVVLILQPGGAEAGLERLEAARALDPTTPFLDRPLSQAHLLAGRRLAGDGNAAEALPHALAALELDPDELDAKELLADCLQLENDFDEALALYEELAEAGRDTVAVRADLHQRAATYELFHKRRERAVEHYRAARALGLDDAGLGFGATVLREEADGAVRRGIEAYDEGDLLGARRFFEQALAVDASHLGAQNHLAVVLFQEEDYAGAAEAWQAVLAAARAEGLALPEPVELNLARAQKLAGREAEARATVEDFLRREPASAYAPEAEELLRRL